MRRALTMAVLALGQVAGAMSSHAATTYPDDPLKSPMWIAHAKTLFGSDPVRFDPRLKLSYPAIVENQHSFPVALDARFIPGVRRMLIFADLNPIPIAIDYRPESAGAYVATRIKLDQRTPVRGAVQIADGSWLVTGGWVDAAGGGCSAPPVSRVKGDWAQHLGEMRGEAWAVPAGEPGSGEPISRLRLLFRHPMDTGFVANIPTYHIDHLTVRSAAGMVLAEMDVWASVSEDPAITIMPRATPGEVLKVNARDTNGRDYFALLAVAKAPPSLLPAQQ